MAYSESYFIAREAWRDWRIEARELMRLARVTRGARVLEIGCGSGGLLRMIVARGARAVGVDTSARALQLARARVPSALAVHIAPDARLPFRDSAFDAILAQHVIEHLPAVDAALREWARVLKPNGRLAVATPNARYPDPAHFADAEHTRVFTPDELRDAITRAGFVVDECFTIFPFLGRVRALRALGVIAYRAFRRVPYFATRGRTIVVGAQVRYGGMTQGWCKVGVGDSKSPRQRPQARLRGLN
ncbi:MAG: class I SAM-dependent methyltransferase, partial [Anaerolineae bacterium]|nr:class I SAM-dependent methyltransferase [Anaerolineae bacterium]